MPRVTLGVDHRLGQEEAVRRMKEKVEMVRAQFGHEVRELEERWNDNHLSFGFLAKGFRVRGTAKVEADRVEVSTELPLLAMAFRGMIEQRVRHELGAMLA